jgi:hypothetical protein
MVDKTPDPCGPDSRTEFDTADVVFHKPTNEHWLVAYVKDDRIAWCGWPEGEAKTEDCALVKKATNEERNYLLKSLAGMTGIDRRKAYAQERLAAISKPHAA